MFPLMFPEEKYHIFVTEIPLMFLFLCPNKGMEIAVLFLTEKCHNFCTERLVKMLVIFLHLIQPERILTFQYQTELKPGLLFQLMFHNYRFWQKHL